MYRIIFHLNTESINLLQDLEIDFTKQNINNNEYLTVIKYCKESSLELSNEDLCSILLGNEFNEFLDYIKKVY
tara:strand:+ start:627 stop:845 length:219 start_codon:yes stop_codon:yes gene_type:complete